ncbi:hypothetical protein IE81DRAFT_255137 [Ceraceosorus guamensis]|uniref:Uncharacterized protein n=1 Tax=Ceraceosorus guamensis TaxID=1522189 RepID=A0A316VQJ7_9BASI|nr:hypothetical protein IE81DRAFT_255137 [Ceraceosorus guamensis]PWN39866.1 hypothetical protein IE81DRAFT_255137 [Ceraceosorus guamensis]
MGIIGPRCFMGVVSGSMSILTSFHSLTTSDVRFVSVLWMKRSSLRERVRARVRAHSRLFGLGVDAKGSACSLVLSGMIESRFEMLLGVRASYLFAQLCPFAWRIVWRDVFWQRHVCVRGRDVSSSRESRARALCTPTHRRRIWSSRRRRRRRRGSYRARESERPASAWTPRGQARGRWSRAGEE